MRNYECLGAMVGEDSYIDPSSSDFNSGLLDGINGDAPWIQSLKSTNYKAGFCKGWKQAFREGPCPVIFGGGDGPQAGARVTRSQSSINAYQAAGIAVGPDTGTVYASDGTHVDVKWDSGGKVERGLSVSDVVMIGTQGISWTSYPASSTALTPAQLAALDRKLTPTEQASVDAWQSGVSTTMQVAEESKGGPKASIDVKSKGATVTALKQTFLATHPFVFFVLGGMVAGGGGLALLWKSHRILGALLGGLALGPVLGIVGYEGWELLQAKKK